MLTMTNKKKIAAKKKIMHAASLTRLKPFNLINCNLCDSNRLYAIRTPAAGALR